MYEERQIAWQDWRRKEFLELCDERRRYEGNRRHNEMRALRNPVYAELSASSTNNERICLDEYEKSYSLLQRLDTDIKTARYHQDWEELNRCLTAAELRMMKKVG